MTNGGQIHDTQPATTAAGSPIVRRPTLQTTTAVTAESAMGTSRSVSQPLPATQNTRHRGEHLLRAAVRLAPEVGRELTTREVAGHQPDNRLVAVRDPERRPVDPHAKGRACDGGEQDEDSPPCGREASEALACFGRAAHRRVMGGP